MIAAAPRDLNQLLGPIRAIGNHIEFARNRKLEVSDHSLGDGYLGIEPTASFGRLAMIESGPKGQNKVLVK